MKKFIAFLMAATCLASVTFAQVKKVDKPKTTVKKGSVKPVEKSTKAGASVTKAETKEHLKKDGTPDKRFKENKESKPAAGPLKKDGTPDMRYKSNKEAVKKKG
jgi:hypothetical protein